MAGPATIETKDRACTRVRTRPIRGNYRVCQVGIAQDGSNSTDFPWDRVAGTLWSGLELNIAIVVACMPAFKPVIMNFWSAIRGHRDSDGSQTSKDGSRGLRYQDGSRGSRHQYSTENSKHEFKDHSKIHVTEEGPKPRSCSINSVLSDLEMQPLAAAHSPIPRIGVCSRQHDDAYEAVVEHQRFEGAEDSTGIYKTTGVSITTTQREI